MNLNFKYILCLLLKSHKWDDQEIREGCDVKCISVCRRCKKEGLSYTYKQHQGEWQLLDESPCKFKRSCNNCAAVEYKEEHHWGEWFDMDNLSRKRICQRCGFEELEEHVCSYHHSEGIYDVCICGAEVGRY